MEHSIHIRDVQASDAAAMSALAISLAKTQIFDDKENQNIEGFISTLSVENLQQNFNKNFSYKVALTDDNVIGFVGLKGLSQLYHLFVDTSLQHQGVARKLWDAVMKESIEKKVSEFSVNSSLNAKSFYEKIGFIALSEAQIKNGIAYIPMQLSF